MLIFDNGLVLAHDFLVETQDLSVRALVVEQAVEHMYPDKRLSYGVYEKGNNHLHPTGRTRRGLVEHGCVGMRYSIPVPSYYPASCTS